MNLSAFERWHRAWITGAGITCIGLSGFLANGCAPLGNDVASATKQRDVEKAELANSAKQSSDKTASQKSGVKVAGKPKKGTAKSSSQIASAKPGRIRVSDDVKNSGPIEIASTAKTPIAETTPPTIAPKAPAARVHLSDNAPRIDRAPRTDRTPRTDLVQGKKTPATPGQSKTTPVGSREIQTVAATEAAGKVETAPKKPSATKAKKPTQAEIDALSNETLPKDAIAAKQPAPKKQSTPASVRPKYNGTSQPTIARIEEPKSALNSQSSRERQRANVLMDRAYAMYRNGYPEESMRLASLAAELEKSKQVTYAAGEERPTDFIAWVLSQSGASGLKNSARAGADGTGSQLAKQSKTNPATKSSSEVADKSSENSNLMVKTAVGLQTASQPVDQKLSQAIANDVQQVGLMNSASSHSGATLTPVSNVNNLPSTPIFPREKIAAAIIAPPPPAEDSADVQQAAAAPIDDVLHSRRRADTRDDEAQFESDGDSANQAQTTQLTMVGLMGLISGAAGVVGLGWWRTQERKKGARRTISVKRD